MAIIMNGVELEYDDLVLRVKRPVQKGQMVTEDDVGPIGKTCKHGFVVRDIQGDNRFLCRECHSRFPRHPSMMKTAELIDMTAVISTFRNGMVTFSTLVERLGTTAQETTNAIKMLTPPPTKKFEMVQEIGKSVPTPMYVGECPKRISDYKEVEDFFRRPDIREEDIKSIIFQKFPDITKISHHTEFDSIVVNITFVDDSVQKIIVDGGIMSRHPELDFANLGRLGKLGQRRV